ncbi:MAG: hypothetical protein ACJ8LG_05220 [Massilia sp.]
MLRLSIQLSTLPVARLCFRPQANPEPIRAAYKHFTGPHPKYKVFRNKSMGMALLDLSRFGNSFAYLEAVGERGYAGPQGRKAKLRGYRVREIDRLAHLDEIAHINQSPEQRQGRPLSHASPLLALGDPRHLRCYGTFNQHGRLVAYCHVGFFGNFATAEELAGYKNRDGVMYLMLTEIICQLIEEGKLEYFMYDAFLGARAGARKFKRRLGFQAYRVRYMLA